MNYAADRLRITGLKEPVVWIKDDKDDKPIAWMAGVGVTGLIPDPFKGYKFRYIRELVSSDGQIVNTGILSQAPGYMGTSTTVAIGGRDLPHGNYIVRIKADNGEEDTMVVSVPDYETWSAQVKQPSQIESPKLETRSNTINNKLKFVNEVYLEENAGSIRLTVERKDQTKRSIILREPTEALDLSHVSIDNATIDKIKELLAIWGKEKASTFADRYIEDHRQETEFFNDIVTLSRCLSSLPDQLSSIMKIDTPTNLLHNRIMTQIMFEYHALGFQVTSIHSKSARQPIYDFHVSGYNSQFKGEVKTIQSFGDIEHIESGGRLTQQSHKSFINAIKDDFEDAKKVGEKGITVVAPWSYRINALLREYFKKKLLLFPPIPSPNTTILVLTSDHVFQDYYTSFPTHLALSILESALSTIQLIGISPIVLVPIRTGLTISMTTGSHPGSSVGYSF